MIDRRTFLKQSLLVTGSAHALIARATGNTAESLVPTAGLMSSLSYFNTWHSQYSLAAHHLGATDFRDMMGDQGTKLSRAEMNEQNLFGPAGLVRNCYPAVRGDLFFILDDGWDVPLSGDLKYTGLLELDQQRFPSFKGSPAERLEVLCRAVKQAGWRGAGVWVPAQIAAIRLERDQQRGIDTSTAAYERSYWIERLRVANAAGLAYWKVDWGKRDKDPQFRELLFTLAQEYAPRLIIETTVPRRPLNERWRPCVSAESNEAKKDQAWVEAARRLIRMPGAFRTYDTITFTGVATTIARNATLLRGAPDATQKATLNCEDEVYIGAALGLALGVQRALIPGVRYVADPSPRDFGQRVTESVRALRWQRIAPPVAAGVSPVEADPKYLWDSWKFSDGQTWLRAAIGKEVWQGAPARVARAIRLPDVKTQGIPPFVLASRHPNGASAIATVGRMSAHRGWLAPRASIAIQGCLLDAPIGIFGVYKDLEISFAAVITKHRVLMQDLAADHAVDVTSEVRIMRNIIIIPGELCDRICASSSADHSEPGVVLRLISRA